MSLGADAVTFDQVADPPPEAARRTHAAQADAKWGDRQLVRDQAEVPALAIRAAARGVQRGECFIAREGARPRGRDEADAQRDRQRGHPQQRSQRSAYAPSGEDRQPDEGEHREQRPHDLQAAQARDDPHQRPQAQQHPHPALAQRRDRQQC